MKLTAGQVEDAMLYTAKDQRAILEDARHIIMDYMAYAEAMRAHGRGFYPSGLQGHSPEAILVQLTRMIEDK